MVHLSWLNSLCCPSQVLKESSCVTGCKSPAQIIFFLYEKLFHLGCFCWSDLLTWISALQYLKNIVSVDCDGEILTLKCTNLLNHIYSETSGIWDISRWCWQQICNMGKYLQSLLTVKLWLQGFDFLLVII